MLLKTKVWVITVLSFIAVFSIMLVGLFTLRWASSEDNSARVYQLLTSTYSTVTQIEKQVADGILTDEVGKQVATQILRQNIYHDSEYVYVADENLDFVAAPLDPQIHGTSFHDFKDSHGKSVGNILLDAVTKHPNGIAEYEWSKKKPDGTSEDILSIARTSERWKWIVGTGIGFQEVDKRFWSTAKWQVILGLIAVLILSGIIYFAVRKLLIDLGEEPTELSRVSNEVASGNFDCAVNKVVHASSVYGTVVHMRTALREIISALSNVTKELRRETNSAESRSEEMEQAFRAQYEETDMAATSMTELSASATTVAESAQLAADATTQADQDGQRVRKIVDGSTQAIEQLATEVEGAAGVISDLGKDVDNIVSVLDVIRGIAEQTNLLALNAAIEAARAGDQGRGFAVVADEVRNLAKLTQDSTSEIQEMIERLQSGSQKAVHTMENAKTSSLETVSGAREASKGLGQIASAIQTITEMNHQIATAAQEQTTVSDDISHRINAISRSSQEAAQLAKENHKGTDVIANLANELDAEIGKLHSRQ